MIGDEDEKGAETRIDCHVHTKFSPDGMAEPKEIVARARARGLDGLVFCDHNTTRVNQEIAALREPGFLLIPGIEVSALEGHCLGIGVRQAIPRGLSLAATAEAIVAAGGIAVPSHPLRRIHGAGPDAVRAARAKLSAIEVYNAHDGDRVSRKHEALAIDLGLGGTGGSDAHNLAALGNAYTTLPGRVDRLDDVLSDIRRKHTWGEGVPTSRLQLLRMDLRNLWLWTKRGFRQI